MVLLVMGPCLTRSVPKMEVMRQVRLKVHLRPMMSLMRPKPMAPMLQILSEGREEKKGCEELRKPTYARPALAQVKMRPCLCPGTFISWLRMRQRTISQNRSSEVNTY